MSKPHHPSPSVTPQTEAIVVQHALAFYRDMKRNAQNAPFGEFLNYAEAIWEDGCRTWANQLTLFDL